MSVLFPNGWDYYLLGGCLIGLAVMVLYIATGRIGGMSPFFTTVWGYVLKHPFFQKPAYKKSKNWRLVYALGLVLGALVWRFFFNESIASTTALPAWQLFVGGILVGFGARLGKGCTSGHGVCGIGARHIPSLIAVIIFMSTAFLTANVFKALV